MEQTRKGMIKLCFKYYQLLHHTNNWKICPKGIVRNVFESLNNINLPSPNEVLKNSFWKLASDILTCITQMSNGHLDKEANVIRDQLKNSYLWTSSADELLITLINTKRKIKATFKRKLKTDLLTKLCDLINSLHQTCSINYSDNWFSVSTKPTNKTVSTEQLLTLNNTRSKRTFSERESYSSPVNINNKRIHHNSDIDDLILRLSDSSSSSLDSSIRSAIFGIQEDLIEDIALETSNIDPIADIDFTALTQIPNTSANPMELEFPLSSQQSTQVPNAIADPLELEFPLGSQQSTTDDSGSSIVENLVSQDIPLVQPQFGKLTKYNYTPSRSHWVLPDIPSDKVLLLGASNIKRIPEKELPFDFVAHSFSGAMFKSLDNIVKNYAGPEPKLTILVLGYNDWNRSSVNNHKDLSALLSTLSKKWNKKNIFVVEPNFDHKSFGFDQQRTLKDFGDLIKSKVTGKNLNLIPKIKSKDFAVEPQDIKKVHWTEPTAIKLLKHWLINLNR